MPPTVHTRQEILSIISDCILLRACLQSPYYDRDGDDDDDDDDDDVDDDDDDDGATRQRRP